MANAAVNVMAEFDIAPDPKTQAIIGFIMACGIVYGPRAVMIRARKEQQKREKAANGGTGKAGVYTPNGMAQGTTDFSAAN